MFTNDNTDYMESILENSKQWANKLKMIDIAVLIITVIQCIIIIVEIAMNETLTICALFCALIAISCLIPNFIKNYKNNYCTFDTPNHSDYINGTCNRSKVLRSIALFFSFSGIIYQIFLEHVSYAVPIPIYIINIIVQITAFTFEMSHIQKPLKTYIMMYYQKNNSQYIAPTNVITQPPQLIVVNQPVLPNQYIINPQVQPILVGQPIIQNQPIIGQPIIQNQPVIGQPILQGQPIMAQQQMFPNPMMQGQQPMMISQQQGSQIDVNPQLSNQFITTPNGNYVDNNNNNNMVSNINNYPPVNNVNNDYTNVNNNENAIYEKPVENIYQ